MDKLKAPMVQLALDFPTVDEALKYAELGIRSGIDIIEAGTPLIVSAGASAIGELARAFPGYPVLADYKTMDSGGKNVHLTQQQGGHFMTVCANAPDETVRAAISAGSETGIKVVTDTIGVKDQAARARQCSDWGVNMIFLHYGADQRRSDSRQDSLQWLEPVMDAVKIPVGIATFGVNDAVQGIKMGASLVAIGHPLYADEHFEDALKSYVNQVKSAV